jgi:hypothetical protein
MYSIGEYFQFEIEEDEFQFEVIGDMIMRGKEYIVVEDPEHEKKIFVYDDQEELLQYIDDEDEAHDLIDEWEAEYYGTSAEIELWDEDYTEETSDDEFIKDDELYIEEDEFSDYDELYDSNFESDMV